MDTGFNVLGQFKGSPQESFNAFSHNDQPSLSRQSDLEIAKTGFFRYMKDSDPPEEKMMYYGIMWDVINESKDIQTSERFLEMIKEYHHEITTRDRMSFERDGCEEVEDGWI